MERDPKVFGIREDFVRSKTGEESVCVCVWKGELRSEYIRKK